MAERKKTRSCAGCKYNGGLFCTAWECPYKIEDLETKEDSAQDKVIKGDLT